MLQRISITLLLLLIPITTLRLLYILPHNRLSQRRKHVRPRQTPTHLLVVLGSGGHTAEMLSLIRNIDTSKYNHRTYVISSGDLFSADRATSFEQELRDQTEARSASYGSFAIATVPRARKIYQSILTTPFSSLHCLCYCLGLLLFSASNTHSQSTTEPSAGSSDQSKTFRPHSIRPDLILTNGPATGVIVVLASLILRFFGFLSSEAASGEMRTIYIESWARVSSLSLSGKILVWVVDRFIVQWERLVSETQGRGEYLGVLVE